ncbi:uncharacterized protein LOC109861883 [Pseudomyrmex gracilis]|uniref:uncharacterized protein LOC109861883 n=1 Tax=Pseudomyrmex gracilis TaxID=219809 RepID=UPI0009951D72|nr:uncharacterized protein LOC109861883 [Pseudomyrmex gracilis]
MNVEQLRRQRAAITAKLTNFISTVMKSTTTEEVKMRSQYLEKTYRKFQTISQELQAMISKEDYQLKDATEESEFEDQHIKIKTSISQRLKRLQSQSHASTSSDGGKMPDNALTQVLERQMIGLQHPAERSADTNDNKSLLEQQSQMMVPLDTHSGTPRESQVRLPIIKLPTFSGQIEDWERYADDTFKTLIYNSNLSNVQKHQYLFGLLSGAAAKVIESMEISDQNYAIAWDLLKKRYEDERAIRKRHIHCLFEMPRVQRESASAIRELVDYVQRHLRVLQAMQLPTESWEEIIIYLIEQSLDNVTKRQWEEHAEKLKSSSTDAILEFLKCRCQVLERASLSEIAEETSEKTKFNNVERDGNDQKQPLHLKSQGKTSLSTIQENRCCYCQRQHFISSCDEFLNLTTKVRYQTVKCLRLCMNCLCNDHFVNKCKAPPCQICGLPHNTLCHIFRETANATRSPEQSTSAGITRNGKSSTNSDREIFSVSEEACSTSGSSIHHVQRDTNRRRGSDRVENVEDFTTGRGPNRNTIEKRSFETSNTDHHEDDGEPRSKSRRMGVLRSNNVQRSQINENFHDVTALKDRCNTLRNRQSDAQRHSPSGSNNATSVRSQPSSSRDGNRGSYRKDDQLHDIARVEQNETQHRYRTDQRHRTDTIGQYKRL